MGRKEKNNEAVVKKEENDKVNKSHLGYIQGVITRMGQNSVQAKEWCITIDSALVAFELANRQNQTGVTAIVIAVAVTALFCLIDTYYLYLERGYRHLYNMAARIEKRDSEFKDYIMKIPKKERGFRKFIKTLFRFTTGVFYLIILLGLVMLLVL